MKCVIARVEGNAIGQKVGGRTHLILSVSISTFDYLNYQYQESTTFQLKYYSIATNSQSKKTIILSSKRFYIWLLFRHTIIELTKIQ